MSSRTVTTQAELDQALANGVATIYINSPAGVWLRVTDSGSSRVVARDSSRVEARGSSRVEAWDSSSVVAWGSSRVEARGSSRVVARDSSSVEAGRWTAVHLWSQRVTLTGGVVIDMTALDLDDPAQWLEYHGVAIKDGAATVYKAVGDDWQTGRGAEWTYEPGRAVTAADWRPTRECGNGLHLGVTPRTAAANRHHSQPEPTRFVACRIVAADAVVFGDVIKVPRCDVLHEVTVDRDRVEAVGA
jgi:hypothetical protein